MARRTRLDLMTSGIPQTGNGNSFDWPGGEGILLVEGGTFNAATIALQVQGPGGVWVPVANLASTTPIGITAAPKFASFLVAAGPIRLAAGAATGVVASVIACPANAAG